MERESMPVDVLFVGGGPACLAGAIHLMDLIEKHNESAPEDQQLEEPMIALIEKGSEVGAHGISGAILDPRALTELIPDWQTRDDFPHERTVDAESMQFLTKTGAITAPIIPPFLKDHGLPIISVAKLEKWLAEGAEEKGVMVFPGFAGVDLLWDEDDDKRVTGVRTGDKGVDAHGEPKGTFELGMDLEAKVTILGEGPRGHLARKLIEKLELDKDSQPQVYEVGCKELLDMPEGSVTRGEVTLLAGYPLDLDTFGGGFIYTMAGDKLAIGLLVSLNAKDPAMDCHYLLQKLKNHPFVRRKLAGGKVVKYGAKTVTVGGWASVPKLYGAGAMLCGDTASFLNPMRIKGIHLSMKTGMLAAETAFAALLSGDSSESALAAFAQKVDQSWVKEEMEPAKNWHSAFENGMVQGGFRGGLQFLFGPGKDIQPFHADYKEMRKKAAVYGSNDYPARDDLTYDNEYIVDKLTDVYRSGTKHDEDQPCHLLIADREICATKCKEEYGNPCERFCPAQVYNMVDNQESGRKEMQVDFANCVHCKTCDIRDPYQIIRWVPPEGGQGPEYGVL
ncbi:MAG: electron transfer flavoprotein-ubiquinone oxidoreductase [Oligoflexia bacterium]|nr:electron transfer flavoprotein-ubiquinone oxidoreductase [Oligoflexia bacterium]